MKKVQFYEWHVLNWFNVINEVNNKFVLDSRIKINQSIKKVQHHLSAENSWHPAEAGVPSVDPLAVGLEAVVHLVGQAGRVGRAALVL